MKVVPVSASASEALKYSCAGPVATRDGQSVLLPPACGYKADAGDYLHGDYAYFGEWVPSGSLRKLNTNSPPTLNQLAKNNRAMTFTLSYSGTVVSQRTARARFVLIPEDIDELGVLTVTVPSLVTNRDRSGVAVSIVVARTDTGQIGKVYRGDARNVPRRIVIPAQTVREVARAGGQIVVRAMAVYDIGAARRCQVVCAGH